jgi:transcriptional regulator with XRE-family HTH domain
MQIHCVLEVPSGRGTLQVMSPPTTEKEKLSMGSPSPLADRGELGQYLWDLRQATGLTLRDVEELSSKKVSNAYLSQLETKKITKPSPAILHELALVYAPRLPQEIDAADLYQRLMELAGYIRPRTSSEERSGRLPTFAEQKLSPEEEEELIKYLGYLRMRKGTSR